MLVTEVVTVEVTVVVVEGTHSPSTRVSPSPQVGSISTEFELPRLLDTIAAAIAKPATPAAIVPVRQHHQQC